MTDFENLSRVVDDHELLRLRDPRRHAMSYGLTNRIWCARRRRPRARRASARARSRASRSRSLLHRSAGEPVRPTTSRPATPRHARRALFAHCAHRRTRRPRSQPHAAPRIRLPDRNDGSFTTPATATTGAAQVAVGWSTAARFADVQGERAERAQTHGSTFKNGNDMAARI